MLSDPKFIAAMVLLVTNIAGLVKIYGDMLKMKSQRAETAVRRDKDSAELRDKVLAHDFAITALKDSQQLHSVVMQDMQQTMSELNVNCAKLSVVVEQLVSTVKDLKKEAK